MMERSIRVLFPSLVGCRACENTSLETNRFDGSRSGLVPGRRELFDERVVSHPNMVIWSRAPTGGRTQKYHRDGTRSGTPALPSLPNTRVWGPGLGMAARYTRAQCPARKSGFLKRMAVNTPAGNANTKTLYPMRKGVDNHPKKCKSIRAETLCGNTCDNAPFNNRKQKVTSVATLIPKGMVVYTNHVNNINMEVTAFMMMVLSRWRRVEGSAFTMVEIPKPTRYRGLVKTKK